MIEMLAEALSRSVSSDDETNARALMGALILALMGAPDSKPTPIILAVIRAVRENERLSIAGREVLGKLELS